MPLQNRVTPFGDILALPQRGLFTGNRGIIHDPATKTLLSRRWTTKTWLICTCDYQGRRREVMARRSWTELFFLDEATALAAGHRPCFRCRREAAQHFRATWEKGQGTLRVAAQAMDAILHDERLQNRKKRIHVLTAPAAAQTVDLPDGAMVARGKAAYISVGGNFLRWTADGYGAPERLVTFDGLITPPSIVKALQAGYRPILHPSAARSN
jgi:hypothetical protein